MPQNDANYKGGVSQADEPSTSYTHWPCGMWRLNIWQNRALPNILSMLETFQSIFVSQNISCSVMSTPMLMFTHSQWVCACVPISLWFWHNLVICLCLCHDHSSAVAWDISSQCVFSQHCLGWRWMPLCMCRLITRPGDQWAHPGIVLLSVFDGVSLQALGWIALCSFRNNLERGGVSGKSQWDPSGGYYRCYKILSRVVNALSLAFVGTF